MLGQGLQPRLSEYKLNYSGPATRERRVCHVYSCPIKSTLHRNPHFITRPLIMIRQDTRAGPKRRQLDTKKRQFAPAAYLNTNYPHRLSLYDVPPTSEITLEQLLAAMFHVHFSAPMPYTC